VAAEEDGPWTPRQRGAQEINGATALAAPHMATPPPAEFSRFTREYEN
jgi:hypothetical protein